MRKQLRALMQNTHKLLDRLTKRHAALSDLLTAEFMFDIKRLQVTAIHLRGSNVNVISNAGYIGWIKAPEGFRLGLGIKKVRVSENRLDVYLGEFHEHYSIRSISAGFRKILDDAEDLLRKELVRSANTRTEREEARASWAALNRETGGQI